MIELYKKLFAFLLLSFIAFTINCNLNNDLIQAIRLNNTARIKNLIEAGININQQDNNGITPIHIASREDKYEVIKLLLKSGARINIRDKKGRTSLHAGINLFNKDGLKSAQLLINYGADLNAQDYQGCTPLHYAALRNHRNMVELLLKLGANKNIKAVNHQTAADASRAQQIKDLIDKFDYNDVSLDTLKMHNQYPEAFESYWSKRRQNILDDEYLQHNAPIRFKKYIHDFLQKQNLSNDESIKKLKNLIQNDNVEMLKYYLKKDANLVHLRDKKGNTVLFKAVKLFNLKIIELLINYGAIVNCRNIKGDTPLHIAARDFRSTAQKITSLLISAGANVNACGHNRYTPLHKAISLNNDSLGAILIENGADINAQNINGWTPLHLATINPDTGRQRSYFYEESVRLLLGNGANPNIQDNNGIKPILDDVTTNRQELLNQLKQVNENLAAQIAIIVAYPEENSGYLQKIRENPKIVAPLVRAILQLLYFLPYTKISPDFIDAIKRADIGKIKELIDSGVDVNGKDKQGATPLFYSIEKDNKEIVTILLNNGAIINAIKDASGSTPIHYAVNKGNEEIINLLINARADINEGSGFGAPIFYAIEKGRANIVKLLLDKGADILQHSGLLLNKAITRGCSDIVKLLIDAGINVNYNFNIFGETILNSAISSGYNEIVQLLIEAGINVNSKNEQHETPLHKAVNKGNEYLIRLLVESGANINEGDQFGNTPLHTAVRSKSNRIIELLLQLGADKTMKNKDNRNASDVAETQQIRDLINNDTAMNIARR